MELLRAGLLGDEGLVVDSTGEAAGESTEDLECNASSSWPAGFSAQGLGRDFTCSSGAESRLL